MQLGSRNKRNLRLRMGIGMLWLASVGGVYSCATEDSGASKTTPSSSEVVVEEPTPTLNLPPSPLEWVESLNR